MESTNDWRSLYPFRSHSIDLGGHHYHYLDEGPATGEPETLLLVHGNPIWSFYWLNIIAGLRDRYRLIAVDHMGCGLSDKPNDYRYTLAQHTENLAELVRRLDLKNVTLLAHDWGGAIGLGAAAEEPQRFARYVLFNTAAFPPPHFPLRIRICRTPLFGKLAVQGLNLFARAAITMAMEDHSRMTPAVRAGLLAPYDTWQNRQAIFQFVKDIPATPRHETHAVLAELEQRLSELGKKPFLYIWGMRDWCFTPACLNQFLTHTRDAEVLRLDDAGHYVIEDAHERIIERVGQFLADHPIAHAEVGAES